MKLLDNLDLTNNQLLNAKLQNLGADPAAAGNDSLIFYNTTAKMVRASNGTNIDNLTNVLESVGVGATPNGISVSAVAGKNQNISLALASGAAAGAMSTAHYSLLAGATSAATASTLVQRDASGNFSAATITADLTGTASNAGLLNNQNGAYYLARGNFTGTQLAATISDFDTQVRTSRLDQMASPTVSVAFNGQRLTGLADPTSAQDAATKNYVDSLSAGLDPKASVRAATSAAIAGATYTATAGASGRGQFTTMPNNIDGVALAAGNRVLVKDQPTPAQNGIYVVTTLGAGANGVWDRAADFDQDAEVTSGAYTFVEEGTTNGTTGWTLSTANPITVGGAGGTGLTFVKFTGGAAYSNGNGLSLAGNVFSVKVDTTTTNPNSLAVTANGVTIATTYAGQGSITTVGTVATGTWQGTAVGIAYGGTGSTTAAGARASLSATGKYAQVLATSATSYAVAHGLNSTNVIAEVYDAASGAKVLVDYTITDANTVTFIFASAPAANAYRVVVVG